MNYKIEDFIGVFDDVLDKDQCQQIIDYFDKMASLNLVVNSKEYQNTNKDRNLMRKDDTVFMYYPEVFTLQPTHFCLSMFVKNFWPCYEKYIEEYQALHQCAKHGITGLRLQRTPPGGGFHQWHFENSDFSSASRIVTIMIFLNDMEEGGETEFIYYNKRIKPKTGRLLIWPSGYPHTHRGNPPISGLKYIITGWLDLLE